MAVALADSVLFSLDADAARGRVLLFLGISFVPFLFVAPLIGPVIDRTAGGRRFVIQVIAVVRVVLSALNRSWKKVSRQLTKIFLPNCFCSGEKLLINSLIKLPGALSVSLSVTMLYR